MTLAQVRALSRPIRLKVYPTGEFSATRVKECSQLMPDEPGGGFDAAMRLSGSSYAVGQVSDSLRADLIRSTLGSSNVPNYHKPVKPRGRKGMTRYNKRLIVNSALLLERTYGRKHLSFLTLTLPEECANLSSDLYKECKRQMLQWLHRRLVSFNLPDQVIGCSELQSSRFANSGTYALHEHWVFVGRKAYSSWMLTPNEIQLQWNSILCNVCGVSLPEEHSNASVNIERVKKSVSAYLGKYLTKSERCTEKVIQAGCENYLPSSWVTKTASMLAMFRRSIVTIVGNEARTIMETLQDNASIFCRWSHNLKIEMQSGVNVWIGFIGYLSRAGSLLLSKSTNCSILLSKLECS